MTARISDLAKRHARVAVVAYGYATAALGLAACSTDTVVLPSRNLERPTDMAFSCLAIATADDGAVSVRAQPMGNCHPSGVLDPKPGALDKGTEYRTYGFVTNAGRGDLSVLNMSHCRGGATGCYPTGAAILDLDPDSVGYGAAPLGVLPEVIAASQDGCRLVTANRGSCDLSLVNPAVLLTPNIQASADAKTGRVEQTKPDLSTYARTIVPRTTSGRLAVAPGEIAFVPQQTMRPGTPAAPAELCAADGTLAAPVGVPAASQPVPWHAVVTFPSCDLIALIELPSGQILDSYRVAAAADATRFAYVHTGRDPVCPIADCRGAGVIPVDAGGTGGTGGTAGTDAGADDGGGDVAADGAVVDAGTDTSADVANDDADDDAAGADAAVAAAAPPVVAVGSNLRVSALAIHPEGKRIYFGATNARFVGALDITGMGDTLAEPTPEISSVELHAGAGGVMRLRLSVDPHAYSKGHDLADPSRPEYGRFVAGRHDDQPADPLEFLYAIARDGSLRVLHVGRDRPFECDLQIDPYDPKAMATDNDNAIRPGCFEFQAPDGPRRLRYAGGPGLRFGSVPADVAFANYRTPPRASPGDAIEEPAHALDEAMLSGAFAFVMTSAGVVYIMNIDPELRKTAQIRRTNPNASVECEPGSPNFNCEIGRFDESPEPLTNTPRDSNIVTYSGALGPQSGPPRLDSEPSKLADGPHLKLFSTGETRINARVIPQLRTKQDTYVYFPNRATVRAQDWVVSWEGDLTGVRITGDIKEASTPIGENHCPMSLTPPLATTITDSGSGFCGLGVDGDVLTLVGCDTDASCAPGNTCVHSPSASSTVDGRPIMGMCVRKDCSTLLRDSEPCRQMLETFRRYEMVKSTDGDTTVVPKRAEITRPMFLDANGARVACDEMADEHTPKSCQPEQSNLHIAFKCVTVTARPDGSATGLPLGPNDLKKRCLWPCGAPGLEPCRAGRVCVDFPPDGKFCAEAAPIAKQCGLEQLFQYKISAGNAFVVSGSASGRTESIRKEAGPNGPRCIINDLVEDKTLVGRIPLNIERCGADSTPVPEADGKWSDDFLARAAAPSPNPCLIEEPTSVFSALFQNTELRFVLTNLQKFIPDVTDIRFSVRGGVSYQAVQPSIDATPGLPARLLLGPIPQPAQADAFDRDVPMPIPDALDPTSGKVEGRFSDLPYMFIVDQRQFASGRVGVRGQVIRITPRISETLPLVGFEGFTAGGRYFPIQ